MKNREKEYKEYKDYANLANLAETKENETVEKFTESVKTYGKVFNCDRVNLRSAATTSSDVLEVINAGTKVEIINTVNGFYKVVAPSGKEGFIVEDYVTV